MALPASDSSMEYYIEDRRQRRLLASVSESATSHGAGSPHLRGGLPLGLLRGVAGALPKSKHKHSVDKGLRPPSIGQAGLELQRLAAVLGGALIAGVTQTAQRLAAARAYGLRNGKLPFHQSFVMPWSRKDRAARRSNRESEALARTLMERGQEYERSLDVRASVQCFEEANKLLAGDLALLVLAAKQWSDLTFYYDVKSDRERQLVNAKAIEYAERAVEVAPLSVHGHVASCVSKGRLALFTDNRTKVRLAKEAQDAARLAITLDPDSDLAHHLMGRWHYEMAQLNVVVRTLVRLMYGATLAPGTRAEALASYTRAAELAPGKLIHRVEAGRVLVDMGQKAAAREQLEAALRCDVDDINAWHTRQDAEKMLAQMDHRPYPGHDIVPPHAKRQGGAAAPPPAALSTAALLGVPDAALSEEGAPAPPPASAS